jgi:hypothetical protein
MVHRNSFLPPTISCALIVALCLISSGCAGKQPPPPKGFITRQQVSAFLDKMDKAANNKDIDAIIPMLSKDVQFRVTIDGFGTSQTLDLNHDQYIDYSRTGFAAVDDYDYRRGKTEIKIEPDGQSASVADEIFETTTTGGKILRSVARTTSILKLENEKLVMARSDGAVLIIKAEEKAQRTKF